MADRTKTIISVHRRTDAAGHVVRITVGEGTLQRIAKIPVDDGLDEAEKLAISIKNALDVGVPVTVFLGETD